MTAAELGGALGPKWLLDNGSSKPDSVISAGFSGSVVTAHSGCLHLEVEVRGQSAHAACPDSGSDAPAAATEALRRAAAEDLDTAIGVGGVRLYGDARLYMEAGIPTVIHGAGPRSLLEADGHNADERLRLDDLRRATTVVARALIELMKAS